MIVNNSSVYKSLITSQHSDKPNYNSWLTTLVKPFCDMQAVLNNITGLYTLGNAVGQQENVLGQWIGISRNLYLPLTGVYFSLDTSGVGLDQGIIYNPNLGQSTTELDSLDDGIYNLLLNFKIGYNNWNGSIPSAQTFVNTMLGSNLWGNTQSYSFYIQDNQNGSMYEGFISGTRSGVPPPVLQQLLLNGTLDLRPAGVKINYFWPSDTNPIFALDVSNSYFGGLDQGSLANFT